MKIRTRSLEGYYASQFAEHAGLTPLINQLVKMDRIPALRYIVFSRRIFYNLIKQFENINGHISDKGLSAHELIKNLNSVLFSEDNYELSDQKNTNSGFEGLQAVIQNTAFVFLLESMNISETMKVELQKELEKAFSAIKTVYAPIAGKELEEQTSSLLELFSLDLPDKNDEGQLSNKDKLFGEITTNNIDDDNQQKEEERKIDEQPKDKMDKLSLMSRQDVADYFKISLPTLVDWEKKGKIPEAVRIGGRVYFRNSDIINHINSRGGKGNK